MADGSSPRVIIEPEAADAVLTIPADHFGQLASRLWDEMDASVKRMEALRGGASEVSIPADLRDDQAAWDWALRLPS